MGKVSNCIKMLNILTKVDSIKIQELSELLNTEERMIRTYKYELIKAGVPISAKRGHNGGYKLDIKYSEKDEVLLDNAIRELEKQNYKDIDKLKKLQKKLNYLLKYNY